MKKILVSIGLVVSWIVSYCETYVNGDIQLKPNNDYGWISFADKTTKDDSNFYVKAVIANWGGEEYITIRNLNEMIRTIDIDHSLLGSSIRLVGEKLYFKRSQNINVKLYFTYSNGVLYIRENDYYKLGPSVETFIITNNGFCGNSDVLTANYTISNNPENKTPSFKWYLNNNEIAGETSEYITVSSIGEYKCEIYLDGVLLGTTTHLEEIKEPNIDFTYSNVVLKNIVGSSLKASTTFTASIENDCGNHNIVISSSNNKFSINNNTVTLEENVTEGNYTTTITLSVVELGLSESFTISGVVSNYPKSFPIKKICGSNPPETIYWTTDADGTLCVFTDNLDNCKYINEGTISVENFYFGSKKNDGNSGQDGRDLSNMTFTNKGTISATNDIKFGDFTYNDVTVGGIGGSPYSWLSFDCAGTYTANNMNMNFRNGAESIKGVFSITNDFYMTATAMANGQNFTIDECALIRVNDMELYLPGGGMKFGVKGHIIADNIKINVPNIVSYESAIITIGGTTSDICIVLDEGSTLNLCFNPNMGSADDLGYIIGSVLYLADETTGWNEHNTPEDEEDLNKYGTSEYWTNKDRWGAGFHAKNMIAFYDSYDKCISEKGLPQFLGMDDDPFLPKDKELQILYNINPCSEEFEDTKIQIREAGNKWFRLINGELIYCENDNQN